jgi:hypothetical protein
MLVLFDYKCFSETELEPMAIENNKEDQEELEDSENTT